MQEYLMETDIDISLDEKKWIFKCGTHDVDIKSNLQWKQENMWCHCCDEDTPKTNKHLLYYKVLLGANEVFSCISQYNELFSEDLNEVNYI